MTSTDAPAFPIRSNLAQGLAWLLLLLGLAEVGAEFALLLQGCGAFLEGQVSNTGLVAIGLAGMAFAVIGRLLTARRPENRISWVMVWLGIGAPLSLLLPLYGNCALHGGLPLPGVTLVAWLTPILAVLGLTPLFVLLPAWFPDGRFMTRRWAWWIGSMLAALFAVVILAALAPGNINSGITGEVPIQNPLALRWPFLEQIKPVLFAGPPVGLSLTTLAAIVSFVRRFRQARGETRQQFKWFAAFLSTVVVVHILGFEIGGILFYPAVFAHWSYGIILALSFGGFPLVIGLTIFRYRLYDIDLIIRRTITYGALTILLALAYFGSVVVLQWIAGTLTGQASSPVVTVVSTLGIAALISPMRRRVQAFIDRRFYRRKYDAERTLARFAATARNEVDMDQLTAELMGVVEETMQPEHARLWVHPPADRKA